MLKFEKMKLLIVIFSCVVVVISGNSALAQNKISDITITGFKVNIDVLKFKYRDNRNGNYVQRDYYEFTDESSPGELKLPHLSVVLALPPESKPKFKISDKVSHVEKFILPRLNPQVNLDDKGQLNYTELELDKIVSPGPKSVIDVRGYFYLRGIYCVALNINPCIYDDKTNSLEIIEQLQIDINYGNSNFFSNQSNQGIVSAFDGKLDDIILNSSMISEFKSNKLLTTDSLYDWIDFNLTYLKMGVADDGIYRVFKQDLENYGINASAVTPNTFKVFLKGKQIPIFVYGEEDNTFNDTDYIEFYGTKNYAEGDYRVVNEHNKPYSEYIDRYSDTTIYWLTWDGDTGLRVDTLSNNLPGIQDTVSYYTNISHFEQNNFLDYFTSSQVAWENPEWIYNESWIWGRQEVGTLDGPFNVTDLVSTQPAKAFWRVQSYASDLPGIQNAHDLGLSINDYPEIFDSGYIDKYEQKIVEAEFSSNLLQNGQNILKMYSFPVENASINILLLDWYEIEYPRYLSLINDSLKFKFNQTLSNTPKILKLTNAPASDYILYKINGNKRRLNNFLRNGNELLFYDSLGTGDEFFITSENKIHSPKFYYKKQFENLVDPNIQADYILISHPVLYSPVNSYLEFIQQNYPVSVKYINVLDIYDQFNYGYFSPEPIKEFLKQAYQDWTSPKPSYLFLVGEANYDYHNYKQITPYVNNIVPSFGHPVSDCWFAIWDSVSFFPQMYVGRLPAKNEAEVIHYLNKHIKYLNDPFDIWNKSYFLLSGGTTESEKIVGKSVNDNLRINYIQNSPTGGYVGQLYATEHPRTNFGPFPQEYIDSVFNNGGLIVSYLGHSGTKIWDNGIENVNDLKNKFNKYPLINDFGCSTGKFAEFDITSFSEEFVNGLDGDAIAYEGNSCLGFTSTSYTFPQLYFQKLLKEEKTIAGIAHLSAKIKLLEDYGYTETNKLFVLCNTLIGDPALNLKIPKKPNLTIDQSDVKIPSYLDDNLDSISVEFKFRNLGLVDNSHFDISIEDNLNNQLIFESVLRDGIPLNDRTFTVNIPIKNKSGEHNLKITLDDLNEIDELYEDDNSVSIPFIVLTTSVRAIVADSLKIVDDEKLTFLNSVKRPATDSILIRLSDNPEFIGESAYKIKFDSLITPFSFTNLVNGKRYWYRTSFTSSPQTIFERNSFIYDDSIKYNFAFVDSNSVSGFQFQGVKYESGAIRLKDRYIPLIVRSAGFEPGGIAKISLDGIDYAQNSQGCGHHIVVIDEATLLYEDYRWFNFWNDPNNYLAYYNYLSSIPDGKLVAISIGGECGGYNTSQELKDILHQFGSVYIDSVVWGSSWILLGKKNAPQGSVPEAFSTNGPVEFDSTFFSKTLSGWFETSWIINSGYWKSLSIKVDSIDNYNQIKIKPIIHEPTADTLNELTWNNNDLDISDLNNHNVDELSFNFSVAANEDGSTPLIKSVEIAYDLVPELATNYQVVSTTADSVTIGEDVGLSFYVYNVGETDADSFNVKVEVINEDNSRQTIFTQRTDSLKSNQRRFFNLTYNTSPGSGAKTFLIDIDSDDEIRELFEDNNFFSIPIYVQPDTTIPTITLTFDGNDILDGDYISPTPNINIELNDQSLLPITDPSSVMVYLNEELIHSDTSIISYQFSTTNPKVKVDFTPVLTDGEYSLKVLWRDSEGNIVDSSGVEKIFLVSNEAKLLNVYNYPNPTSGETHFTFKLTQIPEEIRIKIFTIAGRLVKELKYISSDLKYDFNKLYWDGRDEDGDLLGNGVYLYKVIMKAGDKTEDINQKLAIVK